MSSTDKVLGRLLSSEVKADLLMLFHKNPGLVDTNEGVARRIGRTGDEVAIELKDLLDLGILKGRKIGNKQIIQLDRERDREVQASLTEYFRGLQK